MATTRLRPSDVILESTREIGEDLIDPAKILANRRVAFQSSKLRTPPRNPRFTFSHIHLITRASL
jgi:hypothetical protein